MASFLLWSFKIKDYACITFNEDIFNYGNRKSDSIWVQIGSLLAERMGFEPMCQLPDNRISSAARYDLFDTFPYKIFSCEFAKRRNTVYNRKDYYAKRSVGLTPECDAFLTSSIPFRIKYLVVNLRKGEMRFTTAKTTTPNIKAFS